MTTRTMATAVGDGVLAHRSWLLSLVALPAGGTVVDLGCGTGGDLLSLARRSPDRGARFVGIDASPRAIAVAAGAARDPRVAFARSLTNTEYAQPLLGDASCPWRFHHVHPLRDHSQFRTAAARGAVCWCEADGDDGNAMKMMRPPKWHGHARAADLGRMVRHGLADAADVAQFLAEQETRAREARYFYAITGFAYLGTRRPAPRDAGERAARP